MSAFFATPVSEVGAVGEGNKARTDSASLMRWLISVTLSAPLLTVAAAVRCAGDPLVSHPAGLPGAPGVSMDVSSIEPASAPPGDGR